MIVIRKAKESDVSEIVALWKKTRNIHESFDSYWSSKKGADKDYKNHIKKQILSKDSLVVVAENYGVIIGFSYGTVKEDIPIYSRKLFKLGDLFVEEDFRGKGIAKLLLLEIERFGKKKKAAYLVESNAISNIRANKFYDKFGLKELVVMRVKKL